MLLSLPLSKTSRGQQRDTERPCSTAVRQQHACKNGLRGRLLCYLGLAPGSQFGQERHDGAVWEGTRNPDTDLGIHCEGNLEEDSVEKQEARGRASCSGNSIIQKELL